MIPSCTEPIDTDPGVEVVLQHWECCDLLIFLGGCVIRIPEQSTYAEDMAFELLSSVVQALVGEQASMRNSSTLDSVYSTRVKREQSFSRIRRNY